jgi:hypothetical protein
VYTLIRGTLLARIAELRMLTLATTRRCSSPNRARACRPLQFEEPLYIQAGDNVTLLCNNRQLVFPAPMAAWSLESGATLTMHDCHLRLAGEDVGLGARERAALKTYAPYDAFQGLSAGVAVTFVVTPRTRSHARCGACT